MCFPKHPPWKCWKARISNRTESPPPKFEKVLSDKDFVLVLVRRKFSKEGSVYADKRQTQFLSNKGFTFVSIPFITKNPKLIPAQKTRDKLETFREFIVKMWSICFSSLDRVLYYYLWLFLPQPIDKVFEFWILCNKRKQQSCFSVLLWFPVKRNHGGDPEG